MLKRLLRRERWECADPVWWQPEKGGRYERLTSDAVDELRKQFEARGRTSALDAV